MEPLTLNPQPVANPKPSASDPQSSAFKIVCAILVLGTLIAYGQVWRFEFTNYDDNEYVYENPFIRDGLSLKGIIWAFKTGYTGNWIPVTWLSHMFACQVFGLDAGAHHLLNVAIHAANSLLLFFLLRRMTGAFWRSALVAALFAWHPLHVESVAWVTERKDLLSTLFLLLTIWAYVRYVEGTRSQRLEVKGQPEPSIHQSINPPIHQSTNPTSRYYTLALLFFTLGLMSKSMLVTLPFLLLLLDFWPLRRIQWPLTNSESLRPYSQSIWPLLREKFRFLLLAAVISAITIHQQKNFGTMDLAGRLSLSQRVANALVSCVRYLGKTFWPRDMAAFYPYPGHWELWQIAGALLLLAICSFAAIRLLRSQPWLAVGWFWFLGTLVPVIGIVQVGRQAMADRYTYIPLIGFFIAVVWGIAELIKKFPAHRAIAWTASTLILLACLATTHAQTKHWQNSITLFSHAAAVTSGNALAEYNWGNALETRGQAGEAVEHYKEALRYNPRMYQAHINLGSKQYDLGNYVEATNHLLLAVNIHPGISSAHLILAKALTALGDFDAAQSHFALAAEADPKKPTVHNDWGNALVTQGKLDAAAEQFEQALRLEFARPEDQIFVGLGLASKQKGLLAVAHYRAMLRLNPDVAEALNNLAWLRASHPDPKVRDGAEAVRCAERACELTQNREALLVGTLAAAYAENHQFDLARQMAEKAIVLAQATGQIELVNKNRELLKLYDAGKPYHEAAE